MPRNYYFRAPPGRVRRARAEPRFTPRAAGKYEFTVPHRHSMQFRRVVEAQQPALHSVAGGEFAHHRSHVASRPLHSARRIQLRKESKEHASSLPSTAPEHKMPQALSFSGALASGVIAQNVSKVREVIELLRVKSVTAINHAKIFRQTQRFQDAHADALGLVGEHSHWNVAQLDQRFWHAWICARVIHFMFLVVAEEKLQGLL